MTAMTTQFLKRNINIIWSITNNIYSWCPNVSVYPRHFQRILKRFPIL